MKTLKLLLFVFFFQSVINLSAQNALHFDGINDYVSTSAVGVTSSSARTIEAWINTTSNSVPGSGGGIQHVIVDMGTFSTGMRFTFNILWSNAIRIEVGGSGLSGSIAVNDGSWHHVAVVYDPSSTNKLKLYVDGVLDIEGNISTAINTGSGNLIIGRRVDGTNSFDGKIDEVRLWNSAKTLSDIVASKDIEFCGGQPGLLAYYKFNQGIASGTNTSITSLIDYSGYSNNGTLNSFNLSGSSSNWVSGAVLTAGVGTSSNVSVSTCDTYTSPSGIYTWTTSGIYVDTIANTAGCDSVITIDLTINNNTANSIVETACSSYISPSGNNEWTTTGIYTDTIANAIGCDSVITIDLTIEVIDTSVVQTGIKLIANATGQSYQWIDCDGNVAINGATNQEFIPTSNGNYSVIVSSATCSDTSSCYQIVGVGIRNINSDNSIELFPNPSSDIVTIDFEQTIDFLEISIYDIAGKVVLFEEYENTNTAKLNISDLKGGVYFIKIDNENIEKYLKLIVK